MVSMYDDPKLFREKVRDALSELGFFISPFDNFDKELDQILRVCKGRSYREILIYLLRHGPSTFSEIYRNATVSEHQVNKCLKRMLNKKIIWKDGKFYDLRLRTFVWIREKRTKPTVLLTLG